MWCARLPSLRTWGRRSWLVRKLRMKPRLDPILGIHLINATVLNFLSTHLPLKPEQRAMQVGCLALPCLLWALCKLAYLAAYICLLNEH